MSFGCLSFLRSEFLVENMVGGSWQFLRVWKNTVVIEIVYISASSSATIDFFLTISLGYFIVIFRVMKVIFEIGDIFYGVSGGGW